MNITLDLDDTISACPEFFSELSKLVRAAGGKVYVMTDRIFEMLEMTKKELAEYGIEYDELLITGQKLAKSLERDVDFAFDDFCYEYYRSRTVTLSGIHIANLKKDPKTPSVRDRFWDKHRPKGGSLITSLSSFEDEEETSD